MTTKCRHKLLSLGTKETDCQATRTLIAQVERKTHAIGTFHKVMSILGQLFVQHDSSCSMKGQHL